MVDGKAVPISGYITHAQILVADTVVKEYYKSGTPGAPAASTDAVMVDSLQHTASNPVTLKALFDSTHFLSGTQVVLKIKVWDSNNGYYEGAIRGMAYNRAYILTNQTLPSYGEERNTIFNSLPPSIKSISIGSSSDNANTILHQLGLFSIFFIHTHASPDDFGDCLYDGGGDEVDYTLGPTAVSKIFNPYILLPPYNFVFVSGCNSAGSTGANGIYHPGDGASGFSIQGLDRAFLGTQDFTSNADYPWSECIWNMLSSGCTLYEAEILSQAFDAPMGAQFLMNAESGMMHPVYPMIVGDPKMTLKSVYPLHYITTPDGYFLNTTSWYLPL